jgi:hypothetical protein
MRFPSIVCVVIGVCFTVLQADQAHPEKIRVSSADVDTNSVRVVTRFSPYNLVFKFKDKSSIEIRNMVGKRIQLVKDGLVHLETERGATTLSGENNRDVGLVILFEHSKDAAIARKILRGEDL